MKKILLIEDDASIRELVSFNLEINNYEVLLAEDGYKGISLVYKEKPDLILLDIMLPGKDGFEICKELRNEGIDIPIIMLTAKTEEVDKVLGLEFGADDYISKPFGVRELIARIKAVMRRYDREDEPADETRGKLEIKDIVVDRDRCEVFVGDKEVVLTAKEFELLNFLAANRGIVFSREQLLDKVWGIDFAGETRTVDVHIRHLRKKLNRKDEPDDYIETIRGRGYRFK